MSVFVARNTKVDVQPAAIRNTTIVRGTRATAMAVVSGVGRFLLCSDNTDQRILTMAQKMAYKPKKPEADQALQLIRELDVILVVPNEFNKDPRDGGILITREFTVGLNNHTILASLDRNAIRALQNTQRHEVKFLGISERGYQALVTYIQCYKCCTVQ